MVEILVGDGHAVSPELRMVLTGSAGVLERLDVPRGPGEVD